MEQTNWGDVPTWIASAVAVGSAIWAVTSARSARRSQALAEEAAQRTAAAQERIADAAERFVPDWQITRVGNGSYELRNDCGEPALDTRFEFPTGMAVRMQPPVTRVDHGATVRFNAAWSTAGGGGSWVRITWHRPGGDECQWQSDLPSRT